MFVFGFQVRGGGTNRFPINNFNMFKNSWVNFSLNTQYFLLHVTHSCLVLPLHQSELEIKGGVDGSILGVTSLMSQYPGLQRFDLKFRHVSCKGENEDISV